MGRIANFLLLSTLMQLALILFAGTGSDVTITSSETNQTTGITDLIVNPQKWYENIFFDSLSVSLGLFAAAATIVVSGFFFRNERVIFLGIAFWFLSFVAPIINMWQVLSAQYSFGEATFIIVSLFITPLLILAISTILDFAQGKD